MLDVFGQELRQARENSGLSLKELAAKTKIDLKFLEAMESGDFSFHPDLYMKAFIKDYSKAVGLDYLLMHQKYDAAKQGRSIDQVFSAPEPPPVIPQEPKPVQPVEQKFEKPKLKLSEIKTSFSALPPSSGSYGSAAKDSKGYMPFIVAGVVIIIIVVLIIYNNNKSEEILSESPIIEETQPEVTSETPVAEDDSLKLTIVNNEENETSAIVSYDGNSNKDTIIISPSNSIEVKAKNTFRVVLRSAKIQMLLNNNPVQNFYPGSYRATYLVDSTGYVKRLQAPKKDSTSTN